MIRDLIRIRCCVVHQESNCQWSNCHYRLPDAPCARETDLRLPAGFWLWNHINLNSFLSPLPCRLFFVASSLSPHLAHFLARPVGRSCFRFAGSWIVGLAMGKAESRGAGMNSFHLVLFVVARLKLWLILIACLCHLVSALTNTDDILKVVLCQTFVIKPVIPTNLMTY